MKELRAAKGGALGILFSFDPRRQAILLLGGHKSGEWNNWYEWAVPLGTRRGRIDLMARTKLVSSAFVRADR
jgi:hypothetical protein